MYSTGDVAKLLGVTPQTVRNLAAEFSAYLSPTARPGKGSERKFTEDDVRVFALARLVADREAAHAALRAGQRGDFPDSALDVATPPPALVERMNSQITALHGEIDSLRSQLEQTKSERDEERGKVKLLREQLDERERQIDELKRKLYEDGTLKSRE